MLIFKQTFAHDKEKFQILKQLNRFIKPDKNVLIRCTCFFFFQKNVNCKHHKNITKFSLSMNFMIFKNNKVY